MNLTIGPPIFSLGWDLMEPNYRCENNLRHILICSILHALCVCCLLQGPYWSRSIKKYSVTHLLILIYCNYLHHLIFSNLSECQTANYYNFVSSLWCVCRRLTWRWGRKSKMLLSLQPQILNPNWKNCATTSFTTIHPWRCAARTRGQNWSLLARAFHQPAYPIIY